MPSAESPHHAAIRRERRPLPPHEPDGANYRRWAAAVCGAEARHAADDFWAIVYRLGLANRFDRDDGFGGHEAPFRFPHESHAFAALNWLCHLQAHESDRRGPWAAVRWNTWTPTSAATGSRAGAPCGRASCARSSAIARRGENWRRLSPWPKSPSW